MADYLYLDIETIGAPSPEQIIGITESVKPPGNYKTAETLSKWEAETKPSLITEAISKTALSGLAGQIICIGFAWNDEPPVALINGDEKALITAAFESIEAARPSSFRPCIVGHNVANFDIRFVGQRCAVLEIRMPSWFPRPDVKVWDNYVNDTMVMWGGVRDYTGLDAICLAMGLPGKGNIDGSDIGRLWQEGRHDEIVAYCQGDVMRTRSVHKRLRLAFGEAA